MILLKQIALLSQQVYETQLQQTKPHHRNVLYPKTDSFIDYWFYVTLSIKQHTVFY